MEIAAGGSHTCARHTDGGLLCWGLGGAGQLGPPLGPARTTPKRVDLGIQVAEITVGRYFTCARSTAGSVHCFGDGGLLGSERHSPSAKPLAVTGLDDARVLASGANHTCALREGGTILCWGGNAGGQLGDGETTDFSMLPITVVNIQDAIGIATGNAHTCAIRSNRSVVCWGLNRYGQLGDGTVQDQPRPVPVADIANIQMVSGGDHHTCAIDVAGLLYCWGRNQFGQLGTGDQEDSPGAKRVPLEDVVQVSAGERHTCAVLADGTLHCFGDNHAGQLGLGDRNDRTSPARVEDLGNIVSVSAGESHSCALTGDGAAYCFGLGDGQLGDGAATDRTRPSLAIPALARGSGE